MELETTHFYIGLTEAEDEVCMQWTLSDGRQITIFLEDSQIPETAAETLDGRAVPVHEVRLGSAKALRNLLKEPMGVRA